LALKQKKITLILTKSWYKEDKTNYNVRTSNLQIVLLLRGPLFSRPPIRGTFVRPDTANLISLIL
jgi:hypothetical protein